MKKLTFLFLNNVWQDNADILNINDYNNINELIDIYNQWQIKNFNHELFKEVLSCIIKVYTLSPDLIDKDFNISTDKNSSKHVRLLKLIITNTHELYYNKSVNREFNSKFREEDVQAFKDILNNYPQYGEICQYYNILY